MNPKQTGRMGIVVYRPEIGPQYPARYPTLFDDLDVIHRKIFLLTIGTEKPGKWFFTTPEIERAIRTHQLKEEAFGHIDVEIRFTEKGDLLIPTVLKSNLVITKPEYGSALGYEKVSQIVNRRVNKEIRKLLRVTMRKYAEFKQRRSEARRKMREQKEKQVTKKIPTLETPAGRNTFRKKWLANIIGMPRRAKVNAKRMLRKLRPPRPGTRGR